MKMHRQREDTRQSTKLIMDLATGFYVGHQFFWGGNNHHHISISCRKEGVSREHFIFIIRLIIDCIAPNSPFRWATTF